MDATEQTEEAKVEALWLTYQQAQKLSGLGRTKLWELLNSGEIRVARVGRAVRISRRSLEQFMEHASGEAGGKYDGGRG